MVLAAPVVLAVACVRAQQCLSADEARRESVRGRGGRAAGRQSRHGRDAGYRSFSSAQPRNLEALANLGVVYAAMGRFDDAIASYKKALEISYLSAPIRMNLALAYYKAGRCAEALPEFATVLEGEPRPLQRACC